MRNRYLDLLRAAAIARVVVYHLFGWPWLSILLPAMGIMFALAGSLTAASLDKRAARAVVTSRLRRLLPPLWLLGAIAVPAMLYAGWAGEEGGDSPYSWKLALWLLPIGDPPGSAEGIDAWEPLWYIRAYLWFVLLTPLLYAAWKKVSWALIAVPLVLLAALDKTGFELPFGRADAAMWDFVTYGSCWITGFAHHDGRLHRLRGGVVYPVATVLGLVAMWWLHGHPAGTWDLNDVPESQALWSLAFVLVVLRRRPDMTWLAYLRPLDRTVTLLNNRAVTVYLWHNIAIAAIWPVLTVLALDDLGGGLEGPVTLATTLLLTGVAVLLFGWAEDLAAKRRPHLWPAFASPRPTPPPAAPAGPAAPVLAEDNTPVTAPPAYTEPPRHSSSDPYAEEPVVSWFSDRDRS